MLLTKEVLPARPAQVSEAGEIARVIQAHEAAQLAVRRRLTFARVCVCGVLISVFVVQLVLRLVGGP